MLVLSEWYEARATRAGASDSGGPPPSVPAPRRFDLVLAGSFFGWACWTRSETVFLVVIGVLALQVAALLSRRKLGVSGVAALLVPSLLLFATWNLVYCPLVLNYDPGAQVGYQLPTPDRIRDTLTKLLWLLQSQTLYGPILFVFGVGVAANFARARGQGGTLHLTGFILVVCCYAVLLLFVPSATAEHTAKRGFFKLIPLALLYLGECRLLTDLSARLTRWERGTAL